MTWSIISKIVSTNRSFKLLSMISMTALMTGCATMGGMTPAQCQQSNWQNIGYQDGLMGRSKDYVEKHAQKCAKASVSPDRVQWEQGRQEGLKRYCTPLRAYQLGREGYDYQDVCPTDMTLDLLKAHDEGYLNYQREQSLNQLWYDDDPFWGNRFGYPYYGRWGGWMRTPMPRSMPDYVDSTKKSTVTTPIMPTKIQINAPKVTPSLPMAK